MSRFNNLEFGPEQEGEEHLNGAATKDETFFLREALDAFAAGRFEGALRSFARVLEYNPRNAAAWTGQVRALIELGEFAEAKIWADKALEQFPREPELLASKAVALARNGDTKGAMAFSDAAFEEKGNTPYIWLARADVLLARREKRADYCLDKALFLAPGDWLYRWLASRVCAYYQKFSLALRYAQEAVNLNSASAIAWAQAGQCQAALGLAVVAENSFAQALQLDDGCAEAHSALKDLSHNGFFTRLRNSCRRLFS